MIKNDSIVKTKWYEGTTNKKTVQLINDDYHEYRLDAHQRTPELNRQNDNYRLRGMLKKVERLRFQMFGSLNNPQKTQLFFTPIIGWNNYDKMLAGIAFYNHTVPYKKFEFELLPIFGTASRKFVGMGSVGYTFQIKNGKLKYIRLSTDGKRFSYTLFPEVLNYNKVQPVLTFRFRKKHPRSPIDRTLILRNINIIQDYLEFDRDIGAERKVQARYAINEISYEYRNNRAVNPLGYTVSLQQGNNFGKLSGEFNYTVTYIKKNRGFNIRIFAGAFAWNNINTSVPPNVEFQMNHSTGTKRFQEDYLFDELFFGRDDQKGIFSQQTFPKDGGFRSLTNAGNSSKWLSSVHVNTTVPGRVPIRPYASVGGFWTS